LAATLQNQPNILIIIATYNERENLPRLVDAIESELPHADLLVIDDNSPDGTGQWCDERSRTDQRLHVIHRAGKLGLGSATITGFRYALGLHGDQAKQTDPNLPSASSNLKTYDLIGTMDADFSHDPTAWPLLLECLTEDFDQTIGVVVGSRYIEGGSIVGWPISRHVASRAVNFTARLLLGLTTRDNSGAFRLYRRRTLESINVNQVESKGYAYLEEILWRIQKKGISMKEVPITFVDRLDGQSKTNIKMGIGVFWHLLMIAIGRVKAE
jgi:dolichol-phosphate mannosyltransferase